MSKPFPLLRKQLVLVSAVLALLMPLSVAAQVYKWVDENGKVHFSDKPKDQQTLEKAEVVEIKEAYVPGDTDLTAQRLEESRDLLNQIEADRERERQQQAKASEANKAQLARCEKARERLRRFSERYEEDGKSKLDYFIEDGKPVSSQRQKEIVAEIEQEIEDYCG